MRAANYVQFCLNPFCREVHEGCLPHDNNNSDKTVHNLQLGLEVERPERSTTFSFFSLFYTIKEIFLVFRRFFSTSLYRASRSIYEVSYLFVSVLFCLI